MLVEDDNNLREIYGARLLAEGHDIVSAKDGEEALALAVKEKPELIISDVMMPRISGFDMLDILRNAPETKFTKVIMMTALSQAEDKARASTLGADRYLVKSQVTLEDVAKVVREVLEGKELPKQEPQPVATAGASPEKLAADQSSTTNYTPVASETSSGAAASSSPTAPVSDSPVTTAADATAGHDVVAPVANDNSSDASTTQAAAENSTAEVTTEPVPLSSNTETKQIDVQLPNLDQAAEELKQEAAVAEPAVEATTPEVKESDLSVGPNLAEALKSESTEPSNPVQANPTAAASVAAAQPTTTAEQQPASEVTAAQEANQPAPTSPESASAESEDPSRKKIVIEPIHDLSKPNINQLAEKEPDNQPTPSSATPVPPQPSPAQTPPSTNPNDLISL